MHEGFFSDGFLPKAEMKPQPALGKPMAGSPMSFEDLPRLRIRDYFHTWIGAFPSHLIDCRTLLICEEIMRP
jgi:hypothetical protein